MTKALLCTAGDPGGANALLPVLLGLQQQGLPLQCLAYRQATALWQAAGLAVTPLSDVRQIDWSDYRGLLTATSVNGEDWERRLWPPARAAGLPSLALLDFASNLPARFQHRQGDWAWPDCIACPDQRSATHLHALGAPRTEMTGQPAHDRLARLAAQFTSAQRQQLRQQLNTGDGLCLLYASQPFIELHGSPRAAQAALGFDEEQVWADLLKLWSRLPINTTIWLRPHPREDLALWQARAASSPHFRLAHGGDGHALALAAGRVIGMNSAFLLESCLLGLPVLSYQPGLRGEDPLPSNDMGWSRAVYQRDELQSAMQDWLQHSQACPPRAQTDATGRVVALLLRMLG